MIPIDDSLFLEDFDVFKEVLVPLNNRERKDKGLPPLTEDEITNLFLELRERHGLSK